MLPFWISIALLSLTQGAIVALPSPLRVSLPNSRLWAAMPPASVLLFVLIARAAQEESATALTYIALIGVPIGAVLALGWLARGARPAMALLVVPLFALAWADRTGLAGDAAALALSALSCVALGVLLAAVTPPRWLALGIIAMALADTALVASELLQQPNDALNAARPAAGLPQLQAAMLGSGVMGYGDLFVAGILGGLLAVTGSRRRQWRTAALVAVLAMSFDLLFFFIKELPATVPVALALVALTISERIRGSRARALPTEGTTSQLTEGGPLRTAPAWDGQVHGPRRAPGGAGRADPAGPRAGT